MRWVVWFSAGCVGAILALIGLMWALNSFIGLGLSTHGVVALVLGITITTALAVGLMALIFYSDRSRQDDTVHRGGNT